MNAREDGQISGGQTFKDAPGPERALALHPSLQGVRAVIFDAGGTLVHPDWERLALFAAEETGRRLTRGELRRVLNEILREVATELREGREPSAEERRPGWLFRRMYIALGIDEAACELLSARLSAAHDERHLWSSLDGEAPRVLTQLKRAGFRTAVISNTEDGRLKELLETVQIATHFDLLIDSQVVGCRKPDAEIFHLALTELGVTPPEAVYVGDSYGHDALGALAAGMRAVLLDPLDLHPESVCPRIHALGELAG